MNTLRLLPSVEVLLQNPRAAELLAHFGRPLTLQAVRESVDEVRQQVLESSKEAQDQVPSADTLLEMARTRLERITAPTLLPVINATGVVLHTNLGRAPISQDALRAVAEVSAGYSTLEYDLYKGERGSRLVHAEALLKRLTGAEAVLVVNNNAAAVLLALTTLARRRAAVIARSQLVEIGGGFRVPDVMKQSGARLVEIGTTNRVHLSDYEQALEEKPVLFMRAHRSNFAIIGFTSEPALIEIASVAHQSGILVVDDLGSGSLLDTARYGLGHEPTVQESLQAGADLVAFSGDKLLGGPQAGILVGKASLIAKLRKHPLARAIRADKLCLAALSATLLHYLKDEAERTVPVWRMIAAPVEQLRQRAQYWAQTLGTGDVILGESTVGGGSLPGETLPTWLLALTVRSPARILGALRQGRPPVIARVLDDRVVLDPRTILPEQEIALLAALGNVLIP